MPKQTSSGSPCLNPIAHTYLEHPSVSKKRSLEVVDTGRVQHPAIRHEIAHPTSPYVVRLEIESASIVTAPVASNFLEVTEPHIVETVVDTANDLSVHPSEALAQHNIEIRFPEVTLPPTRSVRSSPVIDHLAVDDLIDQLEPEDEIVGTPHAGSTPVEDPDDEAPLVTLDELLDDVALTEELIDVPTLRQGYKRPVGSARRQWHMPVRLPAGWTKTIALFVGLSFVLVLPIHAVTIAQNLERSQGDIFARGQDALSNIQAGATATGNQEFQVAAGQFHKAASSFEDALRELRTIKVQLFGLADLLPAAREATQQARHLLSAGEASARAAGTLTDGMHHVANRVSESPAAAVALFDVFVEQALPDVMEAREQLDDIKLAALDAEHRAVVRTVRQGVEDLAVSLQAFHNSSEAIRSLLGEGKRQRYLVLFQNNTELRPTGGFWGSFAEMDVLDGRMEKVTIPGGGTYAVQGQLTRHIASPEPLRLIRGRWELQDANWYPDFPTSAQTAMWFYEQSGGPSVDGVIAINADVVAKLIDTVGPINMPDYRMTVDGETFLFETQRQVELDYDKAANAPKAFIGDLAPALLERLTSGESTRTLQVASILSGALANRDIQLYHSDPGIQSAVTALGWDGAVRGNTGDYLMATHTNIGGGKTDGVMSDKISIESTVRPDGRIENTVTVSRTHHGIQTATFSGRNNVSFTRLYVPRGSTLMNVEGARPPEEELFKSVDGLDATSALRRKENGSFDASGTFVGEGFGKTIFGQWIQTSPGETSTLTFRYLLPEDILDEPKTSMVAKALNAVGVAQTVRHSVFVQKQPGVTHRDVSYRFDPGNRLRPVWSTGSNVTQFSVSANADGFFGMVLERP